MSVLQEFERVVNHMDPTQRAELARMVQPCADIAIVGIACRFPGDAVTPARYWSLLSESGSGICDVPPERWDHARLYDARADHSGTIAAPGAGFIGDIAGFDADFFGISPREARQMDPQQRLSLQTSWHALEDAGINPQSLAGTNCAVVFGATTVDYAGRVMAQPATIDAYCVTGVVPFAIANRVSYALDLRGPSYTVDTGCSASLVAVHNACSLLKAGEAELAIVGGVNALLSPELMMAFSRFGILASDGRCKTFDADADGIARGEGCGVLVLERLNDARRARRRIRAVVRGAATNQDGRSAGFTVPNGLAQEAVIREALARARLAPSDVGFIEMHGTGTPLGDPIEFDALNAVYGTSNGDPCYVGSVKANIGHLEAAAGVAGLIKVLLAFEHEMLPPQANFSRLNPRIELEGSRLRVATQMTPWPKSRAPRRAAVSSFGIGGSNAHVILEEYASEAAEHQAPLEHRFFPVSAARKESLVTRLRELGEWHDTSGAPERAVTEALCWSSATLHQRAVVLPTGGETLGEACRRQAEFTERAELGNGNAPRLVFVYPGQGWQWPGMARHLLKAFPAFRRAVEEFDSESLACGGVGVLQLLGANDARFAERIELLQPVLVAYQTGLTAVLRDLGVSADAVIGHSVGEVSAAHAAGIIDVAAAARVVAARSALLGELAGTGGMLATELSREQAQAMCSEFTLDVSVAVHNGPRSTVLSGTDAALIAMASRLTSDGIFCRRVRVDVPAHSAKLEGLMPRLRERLGRLDLRTSQMGFYSTVTGGLLESHRLTADYWVQNLRAPVEFKAAVDAVMNGEHGSDVCFLEVSAHPALLAAVQDCVGAERRVRVLPTFRRDDESAEQLLRTLSDIYAFGVDVEWRNLVPRKYGALALPPYPFFNERHWLEPPALKATGPESSSTSELRWRECSLDPSAVSARLTLSSGAGSEIDGHRVGGRCVVPAAYHVCVMSVAGRRLLNAEAISVSELELKAALTIPDDASADVEVVATNAGSGAWRVRVSAVTLGSDGPGEVYAEGLLREARSDQRELASASDGRSQSVPEVEFYADMDARGLHYSGAYRRLRQVSTIGETTRAEFDSTSDAMLAASDVDLVFQSCATLLPSSGTWLPVRARGLDVFPMRPGRVSCQARLLEQQANRCVFELSAHSDDGQPILRVAELELGRLDRLSNCVGALSVEWCAEGLEAQLGLAPPTVVLTRASTDAAPEARALAELDSCADALAATGLVEPIRLAPNEFLAWRVGDHSSLEPHTVQALARATAVVVVVESEGCDAMNPRTPELVERLCVNALRLLQAHVSVSDTRMLWLTRQAPSASGGTSVPRSLAWGALHGLLLTAAYEHPGVPITLLEAAARTLPDVAGPVARELLAGLPHDRVALSLDSRSVGRLQRGARGAVTHPCRSAAGVALDWALEQTDDGVASSLALRQQWGKLPGPGEVAVRVHAAGLNFRDVLVAQGVIGDSRRDAHAKGAPLGGEWAGVVEALGDGVTEFSVGDEVFGLHERAMCSRLIADAHLVVRKPPQMTFAQAACAPIAYMTAWRALVEAGRLKAHERVLIHSATGGVGLAAIEVARLIGAEVFATAGTEAKRELLRSWGVRHVFDSRRLDFEAQIRQATQGEGVDVVLNSLSGLAIDAGLRSLRPFGRFVEIGKADYLRDRRLGMKPFLENLSFHLVDLHSQMHRRPAATGQLLRRVAEHFADGKFEVHLHRVVSVTACADAIQEMSRAEHVGKIAIDCQPEPNSRLLPPLASLGTLPPHATVLVTGGMGGLGQLIVTGLLERGVRHLVISGRRELTAEQQAALAALRPTQGTIRYLRADLSSRQAVDQLFRAIEETSNTPLMGIIHLAGVLADRQLADTSEADLHAVFLSKVYGSYWLHQCSLTSPLRFFVCFSSAAALLGSPGQGNYAVANAFMDSLMEARVAAGLPGQSLAWGPWGDVGLAAQGRKGAVRLRERGVRPIGNAEGIRACFEAMATGVPRLGVLDVNFARWQESYAGALTRSWFSACVGGVSENGSNGNAARPLLATLLAAGPSERTELLRSRIRAVLAGVLRRQENELPTNRTFKSLGMDSLMAMEFRNRLEPELGAKLPVTIFWAHPDLEELTKHLVGRLGLDTPELSSDGSSDTATAVAPLASRPGAAVPTLEQGTMSDASDAELIAMLEKQLSELESTL